MKKYIVISDFYMPDGRKYENWEIVTFVNDSLKDYFLYEGYILKYDSNNSYNSAINTYEFLEEKKREVTVEYAISLYKKYFKLYSDCIYKESILMKDIINSISIWEFIQQKYFNSNKENRKK